MFHRVAYLVIAITTSLLASKPVPILAQNAEILPTFDGEKTTEPTIRIEFEGDIPLTDFVDYVSERLSVRIVYDESIRGRKVNLVAPDPIPVGTLLDLLQGILLSEGLVMTEADRLGVKRITTNDRIPQVSRPSETSDSLEQAGAAVPITQVFQLKESNPSEIADALRPFLTQPGASLIPLDRPRLLIITDVATNVRRAEQLINILDGDPSQVDVEFVPAKNVSVGQLAKQLAEILTAKQKALGTGEDEAIGLEVTIDQRTNSLILVGTPANIEKAKQLAERLDRALETTERSYTLRFFSPQRLDEIIRDLLKDRPIEPPYGSRAEGNLLIVDSTPDVLELVSRTIRQVDTREAPEAQSPIRFYKIKNVPAEELLETIQGIGANITNSPQRQGLAPNPRTTNELFLPGSNVPSVLTPSNVAPVQVLPTPPAVFDERLVPNTPLGATAVESNRESLAAGFVDGFPNDLVIEEGNNGPAGGLVGEANVTVDVHTNTIIVVATPEVQRIYASLIETLDKRRPQVLIEAQIVIIDTSDNYSLGVEIAGGDSEGPERLFAFSSYGLSEVDPSTGSLAIIPGVGFNGTLVDPSTADVVVQALADHRRARVLSRPRILVNDNAEGQLTSVIEVPFTSVNASQTVATTSFAGFAEAGTTINVVPTISEDNYLQLDYSVTLNSFTGTGSDGVPPPRQTNEVRSRITVPDGHTVIVGGLTSKNESYEINTIPWIELIPIVRDLASLQTSMWAETSLFVFLRPIILKEDEFKDLKYISEIELRRAELPSNFPTNAPLMIE
ncbi:secretin N-terminal domain-containing protein [Crateriforma conspicua]|uniref:secretin N-terminal domain-containing protein n=1 Tax=Crateriforma conspicua TaxID=2527996 RepID=UPI0018CF35F5|nr:secretin N-terminal domain-containing protein [Crateriforma conspicua]